MIGVKIRVMVEAAMKTPSIRAKLDFLQDQQADTARRSSTMSDYRHIEVKPLSGTIGAEVSGVDISHERVSG